MLRLIILLFIMSFVSIAHAGDITIEEVWGIFSMRPDTGAVFMRIKNSGNSDDMLTGARAEIRDVAVELHNVKDGQMYRIDRIPIPAKSTIELKKGGLHIMLFNLPIELKENQEFKLVLIFEKTGEITVPVKLKSSRHEMHHH